jgi:signal transduction histidine kinase
MSTIPPSPADARLQDRAAPAAVRAQRERFLADPSAVAMLEAMPGPALVLNAQRQIVATNELFRHVLGVPKVDPLLGERPGEALACVHGGELATGCGTTPSCPQCGALQAILECLAHRARVTRECRLTTRSAADGGALDFRVHATHVQVSLEDFVVVGLQDVSDEKRRRVLERVFFHDLLRTCGGVRALAERLAAAAADPAEQAEVRDDLRRLAAQAVDEIEAQRQMLAAERGELAVRVERVNVPAALEEIVARFRHHPGGEGRVVCVESVGHTEIETDPTLLRRALGGLVLNALEATMPGGSVTVSVECAPEHATIAVHNHGVIPPEVQRQIFQRSFSTKAEDGHGVGTYGARLLVERHLQGQLEFVSNEAVGTLFVVVLPTRWSANARA